MYGSQSTDPLDLDGLEPAVIQAQVDARSGKQKALYQLSYKAKRVINSIYKKLNGEDIPMSKDNPLFLRKVSYTDKVYRNFIKDLNKSRQQLQRLSQK